MHDRAYCRSIRDSTHALSFLRNCHTILLGKSNSRTYREIVILGIFHAEPFQHGINVLRLDTTVGLTRGSISWNSRITQQGYLSFHPTTVSSGLQTPMGKESSFGDLAHQREFPSMRCWHNSVGPLKIGSLTYSPWFSKMTTKAYSLQCYDFISD